MWNEQQRRGVLLILLVVIALLAIVAWRNPVYISDKEREGALAGKLKDRIDPNNATAEELSALPMLGEARVREIVAFRERELARHPGTIVFAKIEDLGRVRGIGVATARQYEEYMSFPATRPAGGADATSTRSAI